jgi:copper transport protein
VTPLRRRRRAGTVLAGLLFGLLGVLLSAGPASAHAALVRTDPAANAIVPSAPSRVTMVFSERVQLIPGKVEVLAPDGRKVNKGDPTVSGDTLTIPMDSQAKGTYLVSWRVVSADTHPVSGAFTFSVGNQSTPPTANENAGVDPTVRASIPVGKFLGYVGLLLLVGPVMVLALLWPHRLPRRGVARLVWTGFGLSVFSTLAGLWLQAPYSTGAGLFDVGWTDLRDVLGSSFGAVMLVRLGVICAAGVLIRPLLAGDGGDSGSDLAILAVLGVAAVATWPLTGHPSASPVPAVSVVLDAVHLAAMAVWLGGLVMVFGFLLRQADQRELGAILPIWSRWATAAVAALVLAGTVQALIEVGTFSGFYRTTYGRLILVKIGLAAVVLGVAAFSRSQVGRRIAEERPTPLRRMVAVELAITASVLGVTSVLVNVTPARTVAESATTTTPTQTTVSTELTTSLYVLQVDVYPAEVGSNTLHLYAYTPDNKPLKVLEWKAKAALPAAGIEPIPVPVLRITDNHAIGDVALPKAGAWRLTFTLRTSAIDEASVTTTVTLP